MRLRDYLPQIHHAVETVIADLHSEHDHVANLRESVARLTEATHAGYAQAEAVAKFSDEWDDDPMLATAIHWDTYFGVDKDRYHKDQELQQLTNLLAAKEISLSALAGSLLQYAKQGIALQYGRQKHGCPAGRNIGSQSLAEVIWQARNQALHWEDGTFTLPVENCFNKLATEVNPVFGDYKLRNLAYDAVVTFGWRTFSDLERDLLSLDP
ncbi:hypothetical protein [Crenobacter caeni]|uniref:Uncharacterized protein n=1 Tax=Crenobacter caeni TaxID=2705474 RepID=A0A6B2KT54_9NEIS|nr:hypothetical protein [Crenobacter caeni]NDV13426.1 hypothetical protein [Crenobacter caeni]